MDTSDHSTEQPDNGLALIGARSHRQAMDWSLVLASQEISTHLERFSRTQWGLLVPTADYDRAIAAIQQFQLENRPLVWTRPLDPVRFHPAGMFWCLFFVFIHALVRIKMPDLAEEGMMNNAAVSKGDWFRLFSAIFLHGDLAHLMANSALGVLLFGLALGQYGVAFGSLGAYLAGAIGNFLGYLFYAPNHKGLGASGMIMGALGLIAIHSFIYWRRGILSGVWVVRAALAGTLMFFLLGLNPDSDVLAHAGGFCGGILFGAAYLAMPESWRTSRGLEAIVWLGLASAFLWPLIVVAKNAL